ncbi:hypothetical protein [Chamaesiphon sp. OTE_75_metabat_556]|nr:hypothetical protein [Chamaesiphon sp. OTE_75_metabat_556]
MDRVAQGRDDTNAFNQQNSLYLISQVFLTSLQHQEPGSTDNPQVG